MIVDDYELSAEYSPAPDMCYIATVREFPSLMTAGDTAEAALEEMRVLLGAILVDMEAAGESIPKPFG